MPEELDVQKTEAAEDVERPASSKLRHSMAPPDRKLPVKAIVIPIVAMVALAIGWYFFGPRRAEISSDRHTRQKNVPVSVATAKTESVPIEIRTTGNIQPFSVVNVVPQVGGQLQKVYFTQGQIVKKGDLLFQIDPRSYQASLAQAQGNLAKDAAQLKAAQANLQRDEANVGQLQANAKKDQASLHYADVEYQRYRSLVQAGAISMEQADQTMTSAATASAQIDADNKMIENGKAVVNADFAQIDTAKATLEADQAVVDNAKLQLSWCTIRSPIDGRTGSLNVYEGNVVAANNQTALVTIAQVLPIYVSFTIPEDYLDQVRRALAENTLTIRAMLEGVTADSVSGTASFLENTVNTTSGTALLRATFTNTDGRLYPGQFVDVQVTMPPDGPSVVLPAAAIQTTQKGNAVYIVRDGKVDLVPVDLKRTFGDSAAIGKGVAPGDVVVIDGQLQLTPGATVKIVTADGVKQARQGQSDGSDQGGDQAGGQGGDQTGGQGSGHHHRHGSQGVQGGGADQSAVSGQGDSATSGLPPAATQGRSAGFQPALGSGAQPTGLPPAGTQQQATSGLPPAGSPAAEHGWGGGGFGGHHHHRDGGGQPTGGASGFGTPGAAGGHPGGGGSNGGSH